ncbi:toxin-antitoxin system YwqK family antitoxin [Streptomyces sp. NPDC059445]|uniref:toxin-antitoxin system YwqK family antitoxin n=1 Tax=Streptomyces sp. NPDC059445 TaxID=3346832 RepID=UPI003680D6CB
MRIDVDDPELDMGLDQSLTYQGRLFTGETVETNPRTGLVVAMTTYTDGLEDGPLLEWYSDGANRAEGQCRRGIPYGRWRDWHPNGRLALEKEYGARGMVRSIRKWSESGELIDDRTFGV